MKKVILIIIFLSISFLIKAQTYTSDRTITWQNEKVVDEKFNRVEIDIEVEKKFVYISWLDQNYQWKFDVKEKKEDEESTVYNCIATNGDKVVLMYYKPDNEFILKLDKATSFVFQHIKSLLEQSVK